MKRMKVYISGPMTGHDRQQVMEMFAQHEQALQSWGHETVNPCRVWAFKYGWLYRIVGYRLTLLYDLWLLSRCDAIHVLPGSIKSRGCRIEQAWAENFKLKIVYDTQAGIYNDATLKGDRRWYDSRCTDYTLLWLQDCNEDR